MYVSQFWTSDFLEGISSRYPVGDPRGRSCLELRHFVAAPDGRIEEVDDAERSAGRLTIFEIEALH